MNGLRPLGISITWGAGGSTQGRSLDLAGLTQSEYGIDTLLHLTCTNIVQGKLDEALEVFPGKKYGDFEGRRPAAYPRFPSVGSEIPWDPEYLGFKRRYGGKAVNPYL